MDRGSVLRVWLPLALGLYILYFLFVHGPGPRGGVRWIGLALSLIGLAGVMVARYTLGPSFSIAPKATELVTTGIYSRFRNPIYVSGIVFLAGLVVMARRTVWWFVPIIVIVIPVQIIRARGEARVLEARFGDAYRQYRSRTWF